jgi:divalent metal cation (Fe/Co/Zn/Cd) transporter
MPLSTFFLRAQNDLAEQIVVVLFAFASVIFWLWMLIDALIHEPTTNDKILWFLVILFLHLIGAWVYFFVRRSQRNTAMR